MEDQRSSSVSLFGTASAAISFCAAGKGAAWASYGRFSGISQQYGYASNSPRRKTFVLDTRERGSEGFKQKCYGIEYHCLVVTPSVPLLSNLLQRAVDVFSPINFRSSESHHGNSHRCVMLRMRSGQAHQPELMGLTPGVNRASDTLLFAIQRRASFLSATRNGLQER